MVFVCKNTALVSGGSTKILASVHCPETENLLRLRKLGRCLYFVNEEMNNR